MARLIYGMIASLDGYVADETGNFDWAVPNPQAHQCINDFERSVGTYLYGRRLYDVMVGWETAPTDADQPPHMRDFAALWQAADKIVYSRTLASAPTGRTRIERSFDPEAVRQLKADATRDITVGGPELAAQALQAGLVDEINLFVAAAIVGGGTRVLPDGLRLNLELLDQRCIGGGMAWLRYSVGAS